MYRLQPERVWHAKREGASLVWFKINDLFCYYVNHTRNTVAYWWFAQDKLPCQTIKMYSFPEIFHII